MFTDTLTSYNSRYPGLLKFETIEQFENPLNEWWRQCDEDNQERLERFIKRSPLQKGSHTDQKDEEARIKFIISQFNVSLLCVNIAKAINEKQSLEVQTVMFKTFISEFDSFYALLKQKTFLIEKYPFLLEELSKLKEKVKTKCSHLVAKDVVIQTSISPTPKIQWLGKTNVLTTLIYELWHGQEKGKNQPSTKPLIKAQKKDLEELLINNFLDQQGKPLTRATISDYLNSSKPETRVKKSGRIELDY